jgi:hypothetical protein
MQAILEYGMNGNYEILSGIITIVPLRRAEKHRTEPALCHKDQGHGRIPSAAPQGRLR